MMEKRFLTHFLLVHATFFLFFQSATCHRLLSPTNSKHAATVFDVSASVKPSPDVLPVKPSPDHHRQTLQVQQQQPPPPNMSLSQPSFSLSLHPRSAIYKPLYTNYSGLTLDRLHHDSARVESIGARIHKALHANANAPLTSFEGNKGLGAPLTSGQSQASADYFARLAVGQPPSEYYITIDTGSDVSWIQCQPCINCYTQSDPIFDPSSSSTYSPLPCNSPQCRALGEQSYCSNTVTCLYEVFYSDASTSSGDYATETLSFGDSGSVNNLAIGCGHDNKGLFSGSAGILGLGGGSPSLPSQIQATSFSYCLVDRDSSDSATLEFNTGIPSEALTTPLIRNPFTDTFFYVGLSGISVDGQPLNIPPSEFELKDGEGGVIVDTGTVITRLKTEVYNLLRDTFAGKASNLPPPHPVPPFDTCYDISPGTSVNVPSMSFQFDGDKTLLLDPINYLIGYEDPGTLCLAFLPTEEPIQIIGNTQQQKTRVSFDLANSVVGFSRNQC